MVHKFKDIVWNAISRTFYGLYERKLLKDINGKPVPHHIGIIIDGNRRFAERLGFTINKGHVAGRDKLEEVLQWCTDIGIRVITVYAFSTENFDRSPDEVSSLMELFTQSFRKFAKDERVHKNEIRIRAIGMVDRLPADVREAIEEAEEVTKDYNKFFLNVAIAYGGRQELLEAIRDIAGEVRDGVTKIDEIDEQLISKHLYTSDLPDPDLILRTSGEERVSNFLLWQSAYSELYFAEAFWPEFGDIDFLRAIKSYQRRKRRYGR